MCGNSWTRSESPQDGSAVVVLTVSLWTRLQSSPFFPCYFLILWLWILVLGGGMFPLKGYLSMSGDTFWWLWLGGLLLIPTGEKLERILTILQWPGQQLRREQSISGLFFFSAVNSFIEIHKTSAISSVHFRAFYYVHRCVQLSLHQF